MFVALFFFIRHVCIYCSVIILLVYVVRLHESHIMSEKKYFSFWQIWILHILSFKLIYNLPYIIVRKMQQKSDRKLKSCMAQFSFPSVFLAFWAFMISDFIRVTWWRTTYDYGVIIWWRLHSFVILMMLHSRSHWQQDSTLDAQPGPAPSCSAHHQCFAHSANGDAPSTRHSQSHAQVPWPSPHADPLPAHIKSTGEYITVFPFSYLPLPPHGWERYTHIVVMHTL